MTQEFKDSGVPQVHILSIISADRPSVHSEEINVAVQGGSLTFTPDQCPDDLVKNPDHYMVVEVLQGKGPLYDAKYSFTRVKPTKKY